MQRHLELFSGARDKRIAAYRSALKLINDINNMMLENPEPVNDDAETRFPPNDKEVPGKAECDLGVLDEWDASIYGCGDEAGTCTCSMTADDDIDFVYVDGVDKTADVQGDLGYFLGKKTISFACSAATVLAVQASDGNTGASAGCSGGGFAAKCQSTNPKSPWNNLVADTTWKVFGSHCEGGKCVYDPKHKNVVVGAPSGWYLPTFDDSAWDNAAKGWGPAWAKSVVKTDWDICSPKGPAWLFRSPKF